MIPASGMAAFRKEMDRFLDRIWDGDEMRAGAWAPDVDVTESKEAFMVRAEVPGIDPKDIQLTLDNGVLILRGEKQKAEEQKEEHFFRNERHYGAFVRTLRLPANVEAAKVTATFKNGVVTVMLPKAAENRGRSIPITTG
jgi:HSP20 family protein